MKVLILSDIHGNYEALLAVAHAEDADEVWCLGDLVAFVQQPAECVQWVRHHARYCVRGNHDQAMVERSDIGTGELADLARATRRASEPFLTEDQLRFLRNLPLTCDIETDAGRVRLAHAVPSGELDHPGLGPNLTDAELAEALKGIDADFVFCGHTHFPMVREVNGVVLVNPGSVGLPLDGDPRASYAIWKDGKVKLRRVAYDTAEAVREFASRDGLPADAKGLLTQILLTGSLHEETRA